MKRNSNIQKSPSDALLNNSTFGIVTIDADNYVINYCNPKFSTLIGIEQAELIGKTLLSISPQYQEGRFTSSQMLFEQLFQLRRKEEVKFW